MENLHSLQPQSSRLSEKEGLSSEEFELFQRQYIALREEKYALEGERNAAFLRASQLEEKLQHSEHKIQGLQSLLKKLKRSEPLYTFAMENQDLQDKLVNAESNFLLQIDTLRKECEFLANENQKLKTENEPSSSDASVKLLTNATIQDTSELMKENMMLRDDLNESKEELSSLKVQLKKQESQFNAVFDKQLLDLKQLHADELNGLKRKLKQADASITALTAQLQNAENLVADLKNKQVEQEKFYQSQISSLHSQAEDQKLELKDALSKHLASKEEELNLVRQEALEADNLHEEALQKLKKQCSSLISGQRSLEKKYARQLRDLQRDFDKEVRHRQTLQSTVVELRACNQRIASSMPYSGIFGPDVFCTSSPSVASHDSVRELNVIRQEDGDSNENSVKNWATKDNGDDASVRTNSPADTDASGSILLETDLVSVLNRLVETQDENCTLKRKLEATLSHVDFYKKQITSKDAIIQRYITSLTSNRNSANDTTKSLPRKIRLNNISLNSATNSATDFIAQLVKDKERNKKWEVMEFKQLRNLCEELLTRNLQLEEDLSMALELKTKASEETERSSL